MAKNEWKLSKVAIYYWEYPVAFGQKREIVGVGQSDTANNTLCRYCFQVCVCVFSSHSFWTSSSLDVPAGVTQEEGHTGFLVHLLSAGRAFIFLARRI